jgi:hypothetical protein
MDRQALADAYSAITVHADAEQANQSTTRPHRVAPHNQAQMLTVKIRQPSHEFTFDVGMSFIPYPLVLTPVV